MPAQHTPNPKMHPTHKQSPHKPFSVGQFRFRSVAAPAQGSQGDRRSQSPARRSGSAALHGIPGHSSFCTPSFKRPFAGAGRSSRTRPSSRSTVGMVAGSAPPPTLTCSQSTPVMHPQQFVSECSRRRSIMSQLRSNAMNRRSTAGLDTRNTTTSLPTGSVSKYGQVHLTFSLWMTPQTHASRTSFCDLSKGSNSSPFRHESVKCRVW